MGNAASGDQTVTMPPRPPAARSPMDGHGRPADEIRPEFEASLDGGMEGRSASLFAPSARRPRRALDALISRHRRQALSFLSLFLGEARSVPRRSVVAKLDWRDDKNNPVTLDGPAVENHLMRMTPRAETEFPLPAGTRPDNWTELAGTYHAPSHATQAVVSLHLQWSAPAGNCAWSDVSLKEIAPPAPRIVGSPPRISTPVPAKRRWTTAACMSPSSKTPPGKADLIVLGETLTHVRNGLTHAQCAESIPGPSTEYFGGVAKKHNMYIVPGLLERVGPLDLQRRGVDRPRRRGRREISQNLPPGNEVASGIAPEANTPSSIPALAKSA